MSFLCVPPEKSGAQRRSHTFNLPLVIMTILLALIMKGLSSNTCAVCRAYVFFLQIHTALSAVNVPAKCFSI